MSVFRTSLSYQGYAVDVVFTDDPYYPYDCDEITVYKDDIDIYDEDDNLLHEGLECPGVSCYCCPVNALHDTGLSCRADLLSILPFRLHNAIYRSRL